jgi:hypothetical protein
MKVSALRMMNHCQMENAMVSDESMNTREGIYPQNKPYFEMPALMPLEGGQYTEAGGEHLVPPFFLFGDDDDEDDEDLDEEDNFDDMEDDFDDDFDDDDDDFDDDDDDFEDEDDDYDYEEDVDYDDFDE